MGKLNARQVERAQHDGEGFFTLSDGDGLELRVRASGLKIWSLRYQFDGKRRVASIGEYPFLGLAEARDKARGMRAQLRAGVDPVAQARAEAEERKAVEDAKRRELESRRTLADAVERWAELELSKRKTGDESLRALRKDILTPLGQRDIQGITRGDVLDALDSILERGSRRMANRTFSDLKQFFRWAHEREWVESDPLVNIGKDRVGGSDSERARFLTVDEMGELRDALPLAGLELHTEAAIWIMLSTLCRVGELGQARWEHIDLDAGTWVIPADNSKNGIEHTIYLSDFAGRQFERLHERNSWSGWVMPSPQMADRHACLKTVTRQIRDRQRETPLSHRSKATGTLLLSGGAWTPHDLRRSGASLMAELGILPEIIERCLNHVEANRMKRIYQRHEYRGEQREAWERLGARLDEIVNGHERKVIGIREARAR